MRTVICFGGSFNPPHRAHLMIALKALRELRADEVWFIPTMQSPLKDLELAPFEHRARMVELLIKDYRKLKVNRIESTLPSPSYTISTVRKLKTEYPDVRFIWLIGSDQAENFMRWKDAEDLSTLITFAVFRRKEDTQIPTFMIELQADRIYPHASQNIRGGQIEGCPKAVVRYFVKHELYLESIAKSCVNERRWAHIKAMTELALRLGSAHDLDLHQVYIAALFHDSAKQWTMEKLKAWLAFSHPDYLKEAPALWHQVVGAEWVKRSFHIEDRTILKAIRHHVEGHANDALTQVIYIADKCDETRGYDASEDLIVAYRDLKKGYLRISANQKAYLLKEGKNIE